MPPQLIEGKTGDEQHTSSWGKFYLHGIKLIADERQNDKHYSYTIGAVETEDDAIFTAYAASGDKRGMNACDYYILRADAAQPEAEIKNGYGFVRGHWEVLAHGDGTVRGPRLLSWAADKPLSEALARHLGQQIKLRGKAQPNPL